MNKPKPLPLILCTLSILAFSLTSFAQTKAPETASGLLRQAIEAMGGEQQLRALKTLDITAIGHVNLLEQSERPEGPWIVDYKQIKEVRDLAGERLRVTTESKNQQVPEWNGFTQIVADGVPVVEQGGRSGPGRQIQLEEAKQTFALAPERVFLTALSATDLKLGKPVVLQGVRQDVLEFTWQGKPVSVYLNTYTKLPTAIEVTRAYPWDLFWGAWGDVKDRTYLSFWMLQPGGLRYPFQIDVERNGQPYRSTIITDLKLNVPVTAEQFAVPEAVKTAFNARPVMKINDLPLGRPDRPAKEIAPGVIQIPGSWNITIVKQDDGLIMLEAPISSGYSAKGIAEAERRFPGVPFKAVITTSDAWPHLSGIREYAARGIPIFALDLNKPILERMLTAPHSQEPDMLSRSPKKAKISFVSDKMNLGSGSNRLELYPIRGEAGERMLAVYFPEHKLLYASDLVQRSGKEFFMPMYLQETMDLVKRHGLTVENVFAMHLQMTPWTDVTTAVASAVAGQ